MCQLLNLRCNVLERVHGRNSHFTFEDQQGEVAYLHVELGALKARILMRNIMHHCCLVSYYRTLYLGLNEIIHSQKLAGNLDKMMVANSCR